MSVDRNLTTTSISIPQALLDRAKVQAALSYRTFSQHVSYLIEQELNRVEASQTGHRIVDRPAENTVTKPV